MTRRRNAGLRDRWLTAVLRSDLHPACKLVCVALGRRMSDEGKVSELRDTIAADVGWTTPQRVTDRIKQASDKGFLSKVAGGYNGTRATYQAMIPKGHQVPRGGVPAQADQVTGGGVPVAGYLLPAQTAGPGTPWRGGIRARVTQRDPSNGTPPAADRDSPEQHSGNGAARPRATPALRLAPPVRRARA